jgi:hypothetical protein
MDTPTFATLLFGDTRGTTIGKIWKRALETLREYPFVIASVGPSSKGCCGKNGRHDCNDLGHKLQALPLERRSVGQIGKQLGRTLSTLPS